ncbi:ATP-binding cassette domain-containing protein [Lacticaseibacillus paracasei]|uniref:ATP-binding cassette domain-containing protein n=1 Tax=Lacticaseibacillus paracasei TaxID=1597 RepID=UPI00404595B6
MHGYNGTISWDGHDYSDLDSSSLRKQITYIDQFPYIFNESVRFNLTLGQEVSDAVINNAIKMAELTAFVSDLSNGIDTVLQHNGSDISGGQKQRIVLARGFVRNSKFIISDEGTSALDPKSGRAIENLLITLPDTTLIMVTHNLRSEVRQQLDQVLTI